MPRHNAPAPATAEPNIKGAAQAETAFVLVHGGWHNQSTWAKVAPLMTAKGHAVAVLDLPGAGARTVPPAALAARPFDPAAFAAEVSPVAGVTLEDRVSAVEETVKREHERRGSVILAGHSAGGVVVSEVAERVPDLLAAVVYIAGFMLPPHISLLDMLVDETMSSAVSPGLFVGDPGAIGATRINPGPASAEYRALLKESFYADLSDAEFAAAAAQLHADEPNKGALAPSRITPDRFGSVPRHYIRTTLDRAVPLAGQDRMITLVDAAMGNRTITHTLESSHSPFLSQPGALARIFEAIALHAGPRSSHAA